MIASEGEAAAVNATGIPDRGDAHPEDSACRVQTRRADVLSLYLYEVTIGYSTNEPASRDDLADNPMDRPIEVSIGSTEDQVEVESDNAEAPLINSADEPFDPHIQRPWEDLVITVVRNEYKPGDAPSGDVEFDKTETINWNNVVNVDAWWGWAANHVLCKRPTGELVNEGAYTYYRVTYKFHVRDGELNGVANDWTRRILDQGFRSKTVGSGDVVTYETFLDDKKQPINEPRLLDGAGQPLGEGEDAVYLDKDLFPTATFADLDLTDPDA